MSHDGPATPVGAGSAEAGREITERAAAAYRANLALELTAEARRLREQAAARGEHGRVAWASFLARRIAAEPWLLARVPGALARRLRGTGRPGRSVRGARHAAAPASPPGRIPTAGDPVDPRGLRVAIVADEELRRALEPACRLVAVRPDDWREILDRDRPDLLLVESAWRANRGAWQYRIAWYAHPLAIGLADLRALTVGCQERGIPTVFWDTAGWRGGGRFDEAAALFDAILTVEPTLVEGYSAMPGGRARIVDVLAPGVDAAGAAGQRDEGVPASGRVVPPAARPVFVGAFDRAAPLADREALERLLDAADPLGLEIRDLAGIGGPDSAGFPARFSGAIAARTNGSVSAIPGWLRDAAVVLVDAPDSGAEAVPMRLLEAIAAGTPAVTTPSRAIRSAFGGAIPGADPTDDPGAALAGILADPAAARTRIAALRPALVRDWAIDDRVRRIAAAATAAAVRSTSAAATAAAHLVVTGATPTATVAAATPADPGVVR